MTLTVTPDLYYVPVTLSVKDKSGQEIAVNNNKFIMPDFDVKVTATFKKLDLNITYESCGNGTVTGAATAQLYDEVPLTITPDDSEIVTPEDGEYVPPEGSKKVIDSDSDYFTPDHKTYI